MTIYIAGKITGLSKEESDKKFEEAAKMLREQGHRVFIPTVLPAYDEVSHDDYLHICFAMIDICECVYMLKNWRQSEGAKKERLYATTKGKVILYEDESTREKAIKLYWKIAKERCPFQEEEMVNSFLEGFIDCAEYLLLQNKGVKMTDADENLGISNIHKYSHKLFDAFEKLEFRTTFNKARQTFYLEEDLYVVRSKSMGKYQYTLVEASSEEMAIEKMYVRSKKNAV